MNNIFAIDFFCGAGGMTNGLIQAGIHVLAGIDNEPMCEATYVQNRNTDGTNPKYLCMNVFPKSEIHPDGQQEEIVASLKELIKYRTSEKSHKLLFAICAPCQPFTTISQIEMSEGRKFKRQNDANLLLTTVALIGELRPDAIICENVEGILGNDDSVLSQFREKLREIDYAFDAKVVSAANFGIPQNRRRTIGIAFDRKKYPYEFDILELDREAPRTVTVEQTIGHLPSLAAGETHPGIPNHRARALNDLNLKRISCALPGETNRYLFDTPYGDLSLDCHRNLKKRSGSLSFTDTYTRMKGDGLSPTITTKCISISNGRFGHYDPNQNRGITPREAALLQTFPEDYVFYPEVNISFTAKLIGNAVPPKLARFFGKYMVQKVMASDDVGVPDQNWRTDECYRPDSLSRQ